MFRSSIASSNRVSKRPERKLQPVSHSLEEARAFDSTTPDEILCDGLVVGFSNNRVQERLREKDFRVTLKKTDEICHESLDTVSKLLLVSWHTQYQTQDTVSDQERR